MQHWPENFHENLAQLPFLSSNPNLILSLFFLYLNEKMSSFTLFSSIGIVLNCFYLLIFYFVKFSTFYCHFPFAVVVTLNFSIDPTFRPRTAGFHWAIVPMYRVGLLVLPWFFHDRVWSNFFSRSKTRPMLCERSLPRSRFFGCRMLHLRDNAYHRAPAP